VGRWGWVTTNSSRSETGFSLLWGKPESTRESQHGW
jgi:hypothetical protein